MSAKSGINGRWLGALLCAGLLLAVTPAPSVAEGVRAAFTATGIMTPADTGVWSIDQGDVDEAGDSGRFVVKDRTVTGVLSGDINGPFSFTFGTNVPLATQSGRFHGTLTIDGNGTSYEASARGASSLAAGPVLAYFPDAAIPGLPPNTVVAVKLDLSGSFTFTDGAQGNGAIYGTFTVAIDPFDGHILFLIPSDFPFFEVDPTTGAVVIVGTADTHVTLDGQWRQ